MSVCFADASARWNRHVKRQTLSWLLRTNFHNKWYVEKLAHAGCPVIIHTVTRFSCATLSCVRLVPPITGSCFCNELSQWMKSELDAIHPNPPPPPPKNPWHGNIHHLTKQSSLEQCHQYEIQSKCFLGPQSCALVGFLDSVATVTTECYSGRAIGCGSPGVAKSLGSCTKTSFFFTVTLGTTLPAGLVTRYGTLAGWLWAVPLQS
jgi:hypothetical protein